ncbi:hypothetical protein GJV26_28990 [Massilia dura]|uniref:Uncharacterized protein n=1 Tax=Pseudoduganella dura TaxID=321982 RepID=A0A6I3XI04_9BURK|nr:hypothetical protein [Pseudoduganella dura]MUI16464.1 hypothetical protein [Pseudoduganella dura]GGX86989.1 hypothetical protein GCM10007386_17320 [Pseudoduganella dura]
MPARAAVITAIYFLLAIGAVRAFALGLPGWLETALSALAAPAVILLLAWNPLLAPLGLTAGEAVVAPTLLPCLAIVALYAAVVWAVARALQRRGPPK